MHPNCEVIQPQMGRSLATTNAIFTNDTFEGCSRLLVANDNEFSPAKLGVDGEEARSKGRHGKCYRPHQNGIFDVSRF